MSVTFLRISHFRDWMANFYPKFQINWEFVNQVVGNWDLLWRQKRQLISPWVEYEAYMRATLTMSQLQTYGYLFEWLDFFTNLLNTHWENNPSHYNFIHDEALVDQFGNMLTLQKHVLILNCRKKYGKGFKNREFFSRKTIDLGRYPLSHYVKNWHVPRGQFQVQGQDLTELECVVMISINHVHEEKQAKGLLKVMTNHLMDHGTIMTNVLSKYDSEAVHSMSGEWMELDFDNKNHWTLFVEQCAEREIKFFLVVETKNGYHVLLKNKDLDKHQQLFLRQNPFKFEYTVHTNIFCPVPGTWQGGFPVKLL